MSSSSLAKDVLLSLPPMDKIELGSVKTAIKTLPGYHESDLDAWKEFRCLETKTTASGALADALVTELQKYQEKHYCCGGGGGTGGATKATIARHSVTTEANNLRIRTYAELLEPHKFMAGYWASDWILHAGSGSNGSSRKLTGKIMVHVHYYEDHSNVQFRASREAPEFSSGGGDGSSDNDAAAAIVQHMIRSLDKLHVDLLALCDDQVQASLRKVRRILPLTKTRMKWDDAAQEAVRLLNTEHGTLKKNKKSPFNRKK